MYEVVKILDFCYGHRLMDYDGKCAHLHGHNGKVEIEIKSASTDHRGLVVDFGDIKRVVKDFLDTKLDHKVILCKKDPLLDLLKQQGEPVFEMEENPSAENIAKLIYEYCRAQHLAVSRVRLWETFNAFASYGEDL